MRRQLLNCWILNYLWKRFILLFLNIWDNNFKLIYLRFMIIQYLKKVVFWRNIISYLVIHRVCYFDFLSNLLNLLHILILNLYLLLFQFFLDLILFLINLYVISNFLLYFFAIFTFYLYLFNLFLLSICINSNFYPLNISPACLLLQ